MGAASRHAGLSDAAGRQAARRLPERFVMTFASFIGQVYSAGQRFASDARGATAIEYGLIAAVLTVGILAFMPFLSQGLMTYYQGLVSILPAIG